jgi:hypothetical protein
MRRGRRCDVQVYADLPDILVQRKVRKRLHVLLQGVNMKKPDDSVATSGPIISDWPTRRLAPRRWGLLARLSLALRGQRV